MLLDVKDLSSTVAGQIGMGSTQLKKQLCLISVSHLLRLRQPDILPWGCWGHSKVHWHNNITIMGLDIAHEALYSLLFQE